MQKGLDKLSVKIYLFDDLIISRKENYDKFEQFDEYLKFDGGSKLYQHLRMFTEKFLIKESENQFQKHDFNGITIFSDSPELINLDCFKNLNKNITIDKGGDPVMVFKRMASHKGLIASNSTFSLWAGILGEIKNFSIPYYWMKNVKSSIIGLEEIDRYECEL